MAPSRSVLLVILLISGFVLSSPALAQETRATLSGTITDQSGAPVANATLKLVNIDTSVEITGESNQLGQYHFLFVCEPGHLPPHCRNERIPEVRPRRHTT